MNSYKLGKLARRMIEQAWRETRKSQATSAITISRMASIYALNKRVRELTAPVRTFLVIAAAKHARDAAGGIDRILDDINSYASHIGYPCGTEEIREMPIAAGMGSGIMHDLDLIAEALAAKLNGPGSPDEKSPLPYSRLYAVSLRVGYDNCVKNVRFEVSSILPALEKIYAIEKAELLEDPAYLDRIIPDDGIFDTEE